MNIPTLANAQREERRREQGHARVREAESAASDKLAEAQSILGAVEAREMGPIEARMRIRALLAEAQRLLGEEEQ